MYNLEIDPKKLNLLKRSNVLLEKTKKEYKKYEKERKILLELTSNIPVDCEDWENILNDIEKLVENKKDK